MLWEAEPHTHRESPSTWGKRTNLGGGHHTWIEEHEGLSTVVAAAETMLFKSARPIGSFAGKAEGPRLSTSTFLFSQMLTSYYGRERILRFPSATIEASIFT